MAAERSEVTDMTADIEAALEQIGEDVEEKIEEEVVVAEPLAEEPDPSGTDEVTEEAPEGEPEGESPSPTDEKEEAPAGGKPEAIDEPPAGLSPAAREEWKDTPPAMKEAIVKREADFAKGIMQYSNDAKRAQSMDKVMRPHQQLFALNGNNPPEMVNNLLSTAAALQMGTPAQKAQVAAKIINDFGVDIAALDGVLSGQGVPRGTSNEPTPPPQPSVQDQVNMALQQREQQQRSHVVGGEVQAFANDTKNEFYKDVQGDMADILDMAGKRNLNMDLPTAYQRACQLRPDIKAIIDGRSSGANVANARGAAISLTGSPGGAPISQIADESLEDTIRRAMGEEPSRI
jgi:hypothetical protein